MAPQSLTCETCLAKVYVEARDVGRILRVRCPEHGGVALLDPNRGRRSPSIPRRHTTPAQTKPRQPKPPPVGPGVTVTLREQTRGNLLVIHQPGTRHAALEAVCRTADRLDGEWRILTISTPRTILNDLRTRGQKRRSPEKEMLGGIGRLDLLESVA